MKFRKQKTQYQHENFIKDYFYEIGGLQGTLELAQTECIVPRWQQNSIQAQGTIAAETIQSLIMRIRTHPNFERFITLANDDDCECRVLMSQGRIRILIDVLSIEIFAKNQVTAKTQLRAYTLEIPSL